MTRRKPYVVGAICAGLTFVACFLSGAPIFVRGYEAMVCYVFTVFAGWVGWASSDAASSFRPPPDTKALSDAELYSFENLSVLMSNANKRITELSNEVQELRKTVSTLSVVAGLRPKQPK